MSTKLTLRRERGLIQRAKHYARARGTSVSRLVAGFFALLGAKRGVEEPVDDAELPPVTRSLLGSLAGTGAEEKDYRRYLEDKHR